MLVRPLLIATLLVLGLLAILPAQAAPAPTPEVPAAPQATDQAAVCVIDLYNSGSRPCAGLACYGQSQAGWQTCFGRPACVRRCLPPPPLESQVALCVYGDAYNTGGSRCAGAVCVGWTMGHWVNCYPRIPPCSGGCPSRVLAA